MPDKKHQYPVIRFTQYDHFSSLHRIVDLCINFDFWIGRGLLLLAKCKVKACQSVK